MTTIDNLHPQLQALLLSVERPKEKPSKISILTNKISTLTSIVSGIAGIFYMGEGLRYGLTSIVRTYSTHASYQKTASWINDRYPSLLKKDFEGVSEICENIETKFAEVTQMLPAIPMLSSFLEEAPTESMHEIIQKNTMPKDAITPLTDSQIQNRENFDNIIERNTFSQNQPTLTPEPSEDVNKSWRSSIVEPIKALESATAALNDGFKKTYTFLCQGGVSPEQRYMNQAVVYFLLGSLLAVSGYAIKQHMAKKAEKAEKLQTKNNYATLIAAINQELIKKQEITQAPAIADENIATPKSAVDTVLLKDAKTSPTAIPETVKAKDFAQNARGS